MAQSSGRAGKGRGALHIQQGGVRPAPRLPPLAGGRLSPLSLFLAPSNSPTGPLHPSARRPLSYRALALSPALPAPCPSPEFSPVCKKLRASPELPAPRSSQPLPKPRLPRCCRHRTGLRAASAGDSGRRIGAGPTWGPRRFPKPTDGSPGPLPPSLQFYDVQTKLRTRAVVEENPSFPPVVVKTQRGGAVL